MNIFENLENLNVSEECFEDIMSIVEAILNEDIYHAINKYVPEKDKQRLMNKAYDAQEKELYAAAKREERPEDVQILAYPDGSKVDDGIHKSANRIRDRRSPNTKQAENIMKKGTAKMTAGNVLRDQMLKDAKSKEPSGTAYANKEKTAISNKLIKQGTKEFNQGTKQLQDLRYPLRIEYKDGKRYISLKK